MTYHTRSKGTPPSPSSLNHQGKRRVIEENTMKRVETVEKDYLLNELVPSLEQKMAKLEREVIDMRNWAKLSGMGNLLAANQTILPNYPPPNCPTVRPQNPPNSIHVPQHHVYASDPTPPTLQPQNLLSQLTQNLMAFPPHQTYPLYQTFPYHTPFIPQSVPLFQLQPAYPIYNTQPTYFQAPLPPQKSNYGNCANFEKKPIKSYTPLAEPIDQLYERLKESGYITPIPAMNPDTQSKWYDPNKICAYHSGMKGHTIKACRALRDKIQKLINTKTIRLEDHAPNVSNNLPPKN